MVFIPLSENYSPSRSMTTRSVSPECSQKEHLKHARTSTRVKLFKETSDEDLVTSSNVPTLSLIDLSPLDMPIEGPRKTSTPNRNVSAEILIPEILPVTPVSLANHGFTSSSNESTSSASDSSFATVKFASKEQVNLREAHTIPKCIADDGDFVATAIAPTVQHTLNKAAISEEINFTRDLAIVSNQRSLQPYSSSSSLLTIRNLKRWFTLIETMFTRFTRNILECNSGSNTVEYYIEQIKETRYYQEKIIQMVDLSDIDDDHFMLIRLYLDRLDMHLVDLDRAKLKLVNSSIEIRSRTLSGFQEELPHFDGNVLNWPIFAAAYLDIINSISESRVKFRLLHNHLDEESKCRLLADIDPANPDMFKVYKRMEENFENPVRLLPLIQSALYKIAPLKHRYNKSSWLELMRSAKLTKVLFNKYQFSVEEEVFVTILLNKLPPKYQSLYRENLPNLTSESGGQLDYFVQLCDMHISSIDERVSVNLPTEQIDIPEKLCLFCESDYHFEGQCDHPIELRNELIRAKGLCRRCLSVRFEEGHGATCASLCDHCGRDHHIVLCPQYTVNQDYL